MMTEDKMYCYLWEETEHPGECKFGERWVFAGQDPQKEIRSRIRASLGVRKDIFDQGGVRIVHTWDVTEASKQAGRYYQRSRMDDYLREFIGYRKGSTGEIHKLHGDDMKLRVNKLLATLGQPLITAGLSTMQYEIAEEVINTLQNTSSRIVLAELCARFGKTIWSGAVAVEMGVDIVIVASYVKTVFTSFATDLTSFQQFANYAHIDTSDDNYQEQVESALAEGKKVFAYLSLANGSKRQDRIDYLFDNKVEKLLIVDEADFGAHKKQQAQPLVDKVDDTVYTIIMTGTNADRAVAHWPVDSMVSVTYPELLIQKRAVENANKV
jgi:hypothetical protein